MSDLFGNHIVDFPTRGLNFNDVISKHFYEAHCQSALIKPVNYLTLVVTFKSL